MHYIYNVSWSQTKFELVVVEASSKEVAQTTIDNRFSDARYVEFKGEQKELLRFPILNPLSTATIIKAEE